MGNGITPEPWTTSIEFTVTPTDDPDVVNVRQEGCVSASYSEAVTRKNSGKYWGAKYLAARAYFDAHPAKPAPPTTLSPQAVLDAILDKSSQALNPGVDEWQEYEVGPMWGRITKLTARKVDGHWQVKSVGGGE